MFVKSKKIVPTAACLLLSVLNSAVWAACTVDNDYTVYVDASPTATTEDSCSPAKSQYNIPTIGALHKYGVVVASGPGATIVIDHNIEAFNRQTGGVAGAFRVVGGTKELPSRLRSAAGTVLTATTRSNIGNVHGFMASEWGEMDIGGDIVSIISSSQGRSVLVQGNAKITVAGKADLTVSSTATQNSRAIAMEAASLTGTAHFKQSVTATLVENSARAINARTGTLQIDGKLTAIGFPEKSANEGIMTGDGDLDIQLADFLLKDTGTAGIRTAASTAGKTVSVVSTKDGVIQSARNDFIAVDLANINSRVRLGTGSRIEPTGANTIGVRVAGTAGFEADPNLSIQLADPNAVAFDLVGATKAITLPSATVQAPTLWRSNDAATKMAFTAEGGFYSGVSVQSSGELQVALQDQARWNLVNDSSLKLLQLQSEGTLDASIKGGNVALTGDVANAGGVVTLQQTGQVLNPAAGSMQSRAAAVAGDVFQVSGNYEAAGGKLLLDTTLNQGDAATQSDRMQVASVTLNGSATVISIAPSATSVGAKTVGKGILVVSVTGGASASAPGAFVLAAPVINNGYTYTLVRDDADGNWYLRSMGMGQISVKKQVKVPAGAPAFSGSIPFKLTCTNPDESFSDSIPVAANEGVSSSMSVAEGAKCSVAEGALPAAPAGYRWAATSYQQPADPMPDKGTQQAVIINELESAPPSVEVLGQLLVEKRVTVPSDAPAFSGTIGFTVACTNPDAKYSGTIPVANNSGTAQAIDIVAGSACTVTEQLPDAPAGYRWDDASYAQPGTIPQRSSVKATITNTLVKSSNAAAVQPVPALGWWAMVCLTVMVGGGAAVASRRRRNV